MTEPTDKQKEEAREPNQRAMKTCLDWLCFCLEIGWTKTQLDALEALWWEYHDDYGHLIRECSND